ncbi:hypothetical protein ATO00_11260 [Loigolactobacillus coryniformis subsp. coryniformis]|nr:phage tail protein [Loigolactobacillus coryniformis]ATO55921.1 hypothetical protein LC20001_09895 [Loigolactobacillus coryniformis subsp. coryniformis KCTC 3167 = DSM 20001]OEH89400.1 hypothetical protein ATO00_11260 [Loigolactobacillus coryniformis subsp. coryniformis]
MVLTVKDFQGNIAPINNPTTASLVDTFGQVSQITVTFLRSLNPNVANMMQPRTLLINEDTQQQYRLQSVSATPSGGDYSIQAVFLGILHDWNDHYVDGTIKDTQSLDACMQLLTNGTSVTYTIHDSFPNFEFSTEFGKGKAYDLFLNTLVSDFGFEFSIDNQHIDIYKTIGQQDAFVWLDTLSFNTLNEQSDYTAIATHIKGTGKMDDNSKPLATAEYSSPHVKDYGVIDADFVSDERFTNNDALLAYLKTKLQDYPLIQRTITLNNDNTKSPFKLNKDAVAVGDHGYLRARNGVDVNTRITEITRDLTGHTATQITLGNQIKTFDRITADLQLARQQAAQQITDIKNEQSTIINNNVSTLDGGESVVRYADYAETLPTGQD